MTKSCIATLKSHFSAVPSLSISPDGWTLFSGGRDGVVVVWNIRDFTKTSTIPVYEPLEGVVVLDPATTSSLLASRAFGSASTAPLCFATGGEQGVVKIWRSDTGERLYGDPPAGLGAPTAAGGILELLHASSLAPSGLIAATQDCRILFLSISPGDRRGSTTSVEQSPTCAVHLDKQLIGNNDEVTDLRFVDGSRDHSWRTDRASAQSPSEAGSSKKSDGDDGGRIERLPRYIAVATNSEHIRLFESSSLGCVSTLDGHRDIVLAMDTLRLKSGQGLLASGAKDNEVRVWMVPQGRCIAVGRGHVGAVGCVAFARKPDGGFLVSGSSDKLLKVWSTGSLLLDSEAPQSLKTTAAVVAHEKDINSVAVAPNDSVVASASQDRTVKIWRTNDLALMRTLRGHKRGVWSVAFSPVDQAVASASGDKTVRLWSLKDGTCLRTFEGHLNSVLRVQFLSSGAQLLTAGGDGLLKLWNVRDTECVNTFDAHEDKVWALAVSDLEGCYAVSGGGDGSLVLWEDATREDASKALQSAEATLLQEQDLANAFNAKDWLRAMNLAFDMRRPGRLLDILQKAFESSDGGADGVGWKVLQQSIGGLNTDRLKECLEYCREWNAHNRTCFIAQATLYTILQMRPSRELVSLPGIGPVIDALAAYTQRHFLRSDRISRSTFILDHLMDSLNVFAPNGMHNEEGEEGTGPEDDVSSTSSSEEEENRDIAENPVVARLENGGTNIANGSDILKTQNRRRGQQGPRDQAAVSLANQREDSDRDDATQQMGNGLNSDSSDDNSSEQQLHVDIQQRQRRVLSLGREKGHQNGSSKKKRRRASQAKD